MSDQRYRRLPSLLLEHRRRRGLSQKTMSAAAGLDQAQYSKYERGTRNLLRTDVIDRLSVSLSLEAGERDQLIWALEHDRLVAELEQGSQRAAAPLVSAALVASRRLTPEERAGVTHYITGLVEARDKLERAAAGGRSNANAEEPATP